VAFNRYWISIKFGASSSTTRIVFSYHTGLSLSFFTTLGSGSTDTGLS
jgi:hypothetical protein